MEKKDGQGMKLFAYNQMYRPLRALNLFSVLVQVPPLINHVILGNLCNPSESGILITYVTWLLRELIGQYTQCSGSILDNCDCLAPN